MISVSGYQIEDKIYQNARRAYYRAIQNETGEKVIIKSLISANPGLKDITQISHEYEMLKSTNISGLIQLKAKAKYANGIALVIKAFDANPLTEILESEKLNVLEALQIALSLVKTIGELHKHNIIHKDIQPENIFVGPGEKKTWIVDCSVSSFLPREMPNIRNVGSIDGNLAYISPEQTGRMNRPVDYRTDFYSLGTTLYEMLTGNVPFNLEDPLELVHSHLAKQPLPPHQIDNKIPNTVSEIVLKLLSKNAEERYQSTLGIRIDFEKCIKQLNDAGFVERFPLGENDRVEKFHISQKLFGRDRELEILLSRFNGASQGKFEFLSVSGYSGIGKTSLVRELYKPVTRERGYFISGKFDEFHKNIPYGALVSAFRELMNQILTESDRRLEEWKLRLREALGTNSRIITEVIPDVGKLISSQPDSKSLGGDEAQRRFNRVFLNFLQALCSADHPLVIFLDDLQWIDSATLELVDLMMRSEDLNHLLLIGAYRDNEVSPVHPLMITLGSFYEKNFAYHNIHLSPLQRNCVSMMIADTMQSTVVKIQPLANIVFSKTHGNPFFVNQFLTMLHQKKIIHFGREGKSWAWETSDIETLDITDNVIDLLIYRLRRLPSETQDAIRMAACIGFQFDVKTLSLIAGYFPKQTHDRIKPALQEEMIVPAPANENPIRLQVYDSQQNVWFRFQHDRIQQAAYSLVDEDERKSIHFAIGKILLESMPEEKIEEDVFDVLSHLNFAARSIDLPKERIQVAELNLKAGLKAISTAAFEPAYTYLKMGLSLLPETAWQAQYNLTLRLHQACIEATRLTGRFKEMEHFFRTVCQHAIIPLDAGDAYKSRIRACMMQNKLTDAFNTAHEILNILGENFPEAPNQEEIVSVLEETMSFVGERPIEDLLGLPRMKDPTKLMAMNIMSEVVSAVFIGAPRIFPHLICKQVSLSITYGNTAASAFAYAAMGAIICRLFDDIEKGYRFGKLAVSLIGKINANEAEAKVYHAISGYINHWKEPLGKTMELALQGYRAAMETGDFEFAGYNAYSYNKHALLSGSSLSATEKEMAQFSATIKHFKQETPFRFNEIFHQAALNLMGRCDDPVMLAGDAYDERKMLPIHEAAKDNLAIIYFRFSKLMLCTFFCRYLEGIKHAEMLEGELQRLPGGPMAYSLFHFFDSLVRLAIFDAYGVGEQNNCLARVLNNQKKLKHWGEHAPDNYAQKYHLVEAELCRVQGRRDQAIDHYDKAITLARTSEYNNDEALAYELAAKYWMALGRQQFAKLFLQKSYLAYIRWGATAKASQLNEMFPVLFTEVRLETIVPEEFVYSEGLSIINSGSTRLDITTILKANQVISSEILLDKLLTKLMKHSIENAGAERGSLILMVKDEPMVAVQGDTDGVAKIFDPFVPLDQGKNLSAAIVNYVIRSQEPTILNNAQLEGAFTRDQYIQKHETKSVLCFPIHHKSHLTGILYLENTLLSDVFSLDRMEIIKVLSSQMGISIENARLYEERKRAEEEYRGIFENAVEGIYRTAPDGRFIDINPTAARMLGYGSPEEAISSVTNIEKQLYVNPDDRKELLSMLRKSGFVSNFEAPFYKRDGRILWVSLNARTIVDKTGELKFIEGFINDVTERKQATDILIEQEEQLRRENVLLRSKIKDRYKFGRIIGKSPLMQDIYELIIKAAAADENVIIYGESGTGKELVAKAIHEMSDCMGRSFITVNCGAIPGNLIESEFFGYKRGAFTGANSDKMGYLGQADKGTLFLDELGELDPLLQVKLLRVLEGGGFTPLGDTELILPDLRIIAATNRNLEDAIKAGRMREDFFYRIHVIPIRIPPLRERKEDILLLIEHFLKLKYPDKPLPRIPGQVLDAMMAYDWPGNVREFQNTLYRYTTLNRLDFLSSQQAGDKPLPPMETNDKSPIIDVESAGTLRDAVSVFEKKYILSLLEAHKWQRSKVAAQLGIDRKTLYRKISRYKL